MMMDECDTAMTLASAPTRREGGITLAALRAFVAVAEARSFSGAARALGVTQPTVSVQLAALEQACGVLLCHRKPRLGLTEAGRDLFVRARLIVSRVAEFEVSAEDLRGVSRGRLAIGLSAPQQAMPLIARFTDRHPGVEIVTRVGNTSTLLDDITQCRIDVGIMSLMEPAAQFACTLIAAPPLAVCMRRDDPLAARRSLRAAELVGRPFIMREQGSLTRRALEKAFAADGVPLKVRFELGSREAIQEAVAAGLGLGAVFDDSCHDVRLVVVPFIGLPDITGVYTVALKESLDIPTVRAFIDHIAIAKPIPAPEPPAKKSRRGRPASARRRGLGQIPER